MEIRSRLSGDILKLKLRGRLDSVSAEDFYSYLKSKWGEGIRKFLFSCEELEYMESEGICVLARFENFLKNRGASSAYCAFNEECKTLLSFLGFGRSIAFFEDPHRAEEYLSLIKIQDQRTNRSASRIKRNSPVQFYSSGSSSKSTVSRSAYVPEIQTLPELEIESDTTQKVSEPEILKTENPQSISSQSERLQVFLNEEKKPSVPQEEVAVVSESSSLSSDVPSATKSFVSESYSAKSVLEKAIRAERDFPKRTIYCGACSSRIRVSKPGRYRCPACQIQFDLNAMDGVRYLEKLLGT
ncbi:STAS domain-containing protein [Leptospira santarosai]|uniref:Anti-anti-sigma factor n=1 Tax=Leptospira santarosai TaxID=28183 RepID=A0AB73LT25_9LEPT|nr:STAS domain-containing protein [Leptospira santarosai]AVV51258.1 STAS domain protein [Leptospira santarosai]EMO84817.1 STAS domain protein [Leptospira santarosai str. AIM]KXZ31741.1 anti-anti-sigma factor [Leptospira santarosai]MDI7174695.1 STAS domain-containing protein [Leptospira santarosai]MDI7181917.1 STAS domain-containing protein [Leptospira santarosai]